MDVTEDVAATLRAENHGHPPCVMGAAGFCTEHSAKARGIGYEEETSPTLRAGTVPAAVYENHSQDTRYTGPLETAPTVNATYGMGGNNQPFVVETPKTLKIRSGCDGGGKGALIRRTSPLPLAATTTRLCLCRRSTASAPSRATPCCRTIPTAVFMKQIPPGAWTGAAAIPPATRAAWLWWRCRVP